MLCDRFCLADWWGSVPVHQERGKLVQARVVVYRDEKQELCVPISEPGAGIGRDAGNAVQLSAPEVSKQHARLVVTPAGWQVRDLQSRNGLYVNGHRVQESPLRDGDRLVIGPYTLVFQVAAAAQPYKPMLEIDVTTNAARQTMLARKPPAR